MKLSQKVPTLDAHHSAKFQLPTPSDSKVITKKAHSHSFQDHYIRLYSTFPIGSFQDHYIKIYSPVDSFPEHLTPFKTIVQANILGQSYTSYVRKGNHSYKAPFKTLIRAPLLISAVKLSRNAKFGSFQDPWFLVSLQHNGRTASISAPQV